MVYVLKEITGIEDEGKILEHLSSHEWNLEAAVQDALNEKEGIRPIFGTTPPRPSPPRPLTQRMNTHSTELVRRVGWLEWIANLAVFPLRFILSTMNELFQLTGMLTASSPSESKLTCKPSPSWFAVWCRACSSSESTSRCAALHQ